MTSEQLPDWLLKLKEKKHTEYSFGNSFKALSVVSEKLRTRCQQKQISDKLIYALELCLEELVVNTISYAYQDEQEHTIHVHLCISQTLTELVISDDGTAFNPWEVNHDGPAQQQAVSGGLGIFLIKKNSQAQDYFRHEGWNMVYLQFEHDQYV